MGHDEKFKMTLIKVVHTKQKEMTPVCNKGSQMSMVGAFLRNSATIFIAIFMTPYLLDDPNESQL